MEFVRPTAEQRTQTRVQVMQAVRDWYGEVLHVATVHNPPRDDLIHHEHDDRCVCGPTLTPVVAHDGKTGAVATHHRLDGKDTPRGR